MNRAALILIPFGAAALYLLTREYGGGLELGGGDLLGSGLDVPGGTDTAGGPTDTAGADLSRVDAAAYFSELELGDGSLVNDLANGWAAMTAAARKVFTLPSSAQPYAGAIADAEEANGIPATLLGRLLYQESRFKPEVIDGTKTSGAGALGIAQFMPSTARELGIDPLDPLQAINGAAAYLRRLFDLTGAWDKALAAYNGGIGNLQRRGSIAAMKPETRAYVSQILNDVQVM